MNKTKEIKKILLGSLMVNENGSIQMRPKHVHMGLSSGVQGWFWVLCFGVMMRTRTYHCDKNRTKAEKFVDDSLQMTGRLLKLEDNPDMLACLTGYPLTTPGIFAVEVVEKEKGTDINVTYCTGRSPFCLLRTLRQFWKLEKKLGDLFGRVKEQKEKNLQKK